MALPEQFALLHSELNPFLFAAVGKEENGAELSVLSAFARLDIDPWTEGARLSKLPKEAAARALMALIALFPDHGRSSADVRETAARLVELLPRWSAATAPGVAAPAGARRPYRPAIQHLWLGLGLALAVLFLAMAAHGLFPWP